MTFPRGVTLLEVTFVVAILVALFGMTAFGLSHFQRAVATVASDRDVTNALAIAARRARDGMQGSAWGVYIPYNETTRTTSSIVIFAGASYAARNPALDLTFSASEEIAFVAVDFSGAAQDATNSHEIVFTPYSGATTQYGSVTLEWYGAARVLTIGSNGIPVRQ